MEYGFFDNINIEDYHDYSKYPAASSSMLKSIKNNSPLHVKAVMDGIAKKSTPALIFGNHSHNILLDNSISNYVLQPARRINEKGQEVAFVRNGKHWEEFKAAADSEKKLIVTEAELETLIGMFDGLMSNPTSKAILESPTKQIELSGFWKHEDYEFDCKLRTDILDQSIDVIADYKSTRDASPEVFSNQFFGYGYDIQAYWYRLGVYAITGRWFDMVFIAQEKDPPYAVCCYSVPPEVFDIGKTRAGYSARVFAECLKNDKWPGYPEMVEINVAGWALNEANNIKLRLSNED